MGENLTRHGLKDRLIGQAPSLSLQEGLTYFQGSQDEEGGDRAFFLAKNPTVDEVWAFRQSLVHEVSVLNDLKHTLVVLGTTRFGFSRAMPRDGVFGGLDLIEGLRSRMHFHLDSHNEIPTFSDLVHAVRYPPGEAAYVWTKIGVFRYIVPKDFLTHKWQMGYSVLPNEEILNTWDEVPQIASLQDQLRLSNWQSKGADIQFYPKDSDQLNEVINKIF